MLDIIPVLAPSGLADIIDHYGDPKIRIGNDGAWKVDPAWESANCITVQHGLLPRGKLYVHRYIAQPTLNVLDRWSARIAAGDPYKLRTMGCFAPRAQRGSNGLLASTHSWAIAWDVNADTNPLITNIEIDDARRQTAKDIPDAWIADAQAEGFFWGGSFSHRFDPQHFQLARGY